MNYGTIVVLITGTFLARGPVGATPPSPDSKA